MSRTELNNHIDYLIRRRDNVLDTVPPKYAIYFIDYYENAINTLVDYLVDLA